MCPPRPLSFRTLLLVLVLAVVSAPRPAAAHDEGFSGLRVLIEADRVRLEATIHTRDLNNWFPPRRFPDYVEGVCREFERQGPGLYEVHLNYAVVPPRLVKARLAEPGLIQVDLEYPYGGTLDSLKVQFNQFKLLPRGHAQWVVVDDARNLRPGGKPRSLLQDRIDADASMTVLEPIPSPPPPPTYAVPAATMPTTGPATRPGDAASPLAAPAVTDAGGGEDTRPAESRINFFTDGVLHILTGYDHLLFVAALLLACRTFGEAATIITFFTVAHSVTLGLSATNVVRVPEKLIEPAVAATILFVAVENLYHRPRLAWRCGVTLFFGLIHGLAFAKDLQKKLHGETFADIAWPLVQFSAGVEVGHLSLVALALPLLLYLKSRTPTFDRWVSPGLSGVICAFGAFWLVTRVWENVTGAG